MGGAGWKWVQAHLHSTSAVDLLQSGHKTFYIDGGMILHKAFYNNPECALPGNNLSSMLQWIVEKLENLRLTGFDPIIVLDGAMPDSKMETTEQREESRKAQDCLTSSHHRSVQQHTHALATMSLARVSC